MSFNYSLVVRKSLLVASLLTLGLVCFSGCKKKDAAAPEAAQNADAGHDHEGHDHEGHEGHDHEHAEADAQAENDNGMPPSSEADKADPNANKPLAPPISVADVPEGAWYCNMGTVHYYRHEKGDGKCAICGMELVEKTAEDAQ